MQRLLFWILLALFLVSNVYLPNTFAQDYMQWHLPQGAKARFGKGEITEIAYSPDGTRLAVASKIGTWIYDAHTGEELDLLTGDTSPVYSISFNPDDGTLATASPTRIYLWDIETGTRTLTIDTFTPGVGGLSLVSHSVRMVKRSQVWDGKKSVCGM